MTAAELIAKLYEMPPDAEVECDFDEGYTEPHDPVLLDNGKVWIGVA